MKSEIPIHVEDYLASSLQVFEHYTDEALLEERIARSCQAFRFLRCVRNINLDSYVASHRILLGEDRLFHAPTETTVIRDLATTVGGYLMPPMNREVKDLFGQALKDADRRGAFATADFVTKVNPFYRANGVSARLLYVSLVERGVESGREIDEKLGFDQVARQVYEEQVDWLAQSYPIGAGHPDLQYDTPKLAGYNWANILELELR